MIHYFDKYGFWLRFNLFSGRGVCVRWDVPEFSIRAGYTKCLVKIGNFRVQILDKLN